VTATQGELSEALQKAFAEHDVLYYEYRTDELAGMLLPVLDAAHAEGYRQAVAHVEMVLRVLDQTGEPVFVKTAAAIRAALDKP